MEYGAFLHFYAVAVHHGQIGNLFCLIPPKIEGSTERGYGDTVSFPAIKDIYKTHLNGSVILWICLFVK